MLESPTAPPIAPWIAPGTLLAGALAAALLAWACGGDPEPGNEPDTTDVAPDEGDSSSDAADTTSDPDGVDASEVETRDAPDTSDEVGDAPDAADTGDADDTALDSADGSGADVGSDAGGGAPLNLGPPDVDLESPAGLRTETIRYTVPGLELERALELHVWYATDDTSGEASLFLVSRDAFAWRDASVSAPSESAPAPVVFYSHGGRGFAGQISTVARQFVRNGWIFVGVPHPGDNLFDFSNDNPFAFDIVRAYDSRAALDYFADLPEGHPLRGRVDTSKVLAMGHSFGGQNAWFLVGLALDLDRIRERCGEDCTEADMGPYEGYRADPRFGAAVSMESRIDSNLVQDASFAELEAPILHMSGTESNDATELFARASGADLTWVSLIGGCHESFTGTLVCPTLPLSESLAVTATYSIAFATRHVLGSDDPGVLGILDGSVEVSESVALSLSARARGE